ncbi:unnamed protein product [Closterium sp. Yama58-4]|nr:unnamed protein product [Closterium sp. Yama58-4]
MTRLKSHVYVGKARWLWCTHGSLTGSSPCSPLPHQVLVTHAQLAPATPFTFTISPWLLSEASAAVRPSPPLSPTSLSHHHHLPLRPPPSHTLSHHFSSHTALLGLLLCQ